MAESARQIEIARRQHAVAAQQTVRQIAAQIGFPATDAEEIVLAAAELASNLLRHAGHGQIVIKQLAHDEQTAIEIEASDTGPGIANVDQSLADGFSTAGGLGYGLGSVNRLMDEMEISSSPSHGTQIICRRWLTKETRPQIPMNWDVGAATRSRRNAPDNGDAFLTVKLPSSLLVGLIDGLGHGQLAQKAALTAQQYVRKHPYLALDKIFAGVNRACRGTRGVVMALARLEAETLTFASVGNIEARVWSGVNPVRLLVTRGILGVGIPKISAHKVPWQKEWLLVLHTDGVGSSWEWRDMGNTRQEPAQTLAAKLLRNFSSEDDDATTVVVRML